MYSLSNSQFAGVSIRKLAIINIAVCGLLAVSGCASIGGAQGDGASRQAAQAAASRAPAEWQTALPHGGNVAQLQAWWQQLDDPLLLQVLEAAQQKSANIALARAAIEQARAGMVSAQAALLPNLSAGLAATRGVSAPNAPIANFAQLQLQAAWEIDVFGRARSAASAASERLASAQARWHDARVTVAATAAGQYYSLRLCQQQLALTGRDAASRLETARLGDLTAQAGLLAPATAALGRASAADAASGLIAKQAECDIAALGLAALTGLDAAPLRAKLGYRSAGQAETAPASSPPVWPAGDLFSISAIPANVLQQRPDLAVAQREVAAARQDITAAERARYPALSLSGFVGTARTASAGFSSNGPTWSLGPLAVSLPIFDGGRISANVQASAANYDAAVAVLAEKTRGAVREVEEALVNLQAVSSRSADVQAAARGYQAALDAAQARYRAGLASLLELEDTRRIALAAQNNTIALEQARIAAWISLYRAAGGGWDAATLAQTALPAQ